MAFKLIHTSTLLVEPMVGDSIPDYAILSHTWTPREEVSFQEMSSIYHPSHPARQKSGFIKIVKFCETARQAGFEYAWIDTCCIDQSSSVELSEAINSMFRWYQKAGVCYVYLDDLTPGSALEACMPQCRWFTRGWCLQELIGPRDVKFYNNRWECLGSKLDPYLGVIVARASKVDLEVLVDATVLPAFSVAQKMSWAAHRETTRPEDIAYCLLGIFDVNMPLLYGEGQKAFMRLQEEIIKQSNDLSIFAWGHPETTCFRPPGRRRTVGRNEGADIIRNNRSPDRLDYCNLFAKSPSDFLGCGSLALQISPTRRNFAFSMSNNGLFLSRAKLRVDFENSCYLLPLLCYEKHSPLSGIYLALKRVGPDLFARLRHCCWDELYFWDKKVDGYIISRMTLEARDFVGRFYIESVHLYSPACSSNALHRAILDVSPEDTWDFASLAFLRSGSHRFSGYAKFSTQILSTALNVTIEPDWDDFYIAWGCLTLTENSNSGRFRETIWVRFYWARDWAGQPNLIDHIMDGGDISARSRLESDGIEHGSKLVYAEVSSIDDNGGKYFRISIEIR